MSSAEQTPPNPDRPEVELKVSEAKNRDVIRGKIRLDNEAMKQIGISTGEIVEIIGEKSTAAVAWPAYPEDLKRNIIRMDSVIRKNAGVSLSDKVRVRKAEVTNACLLYTSPSPRDVEESRMPSSA